MAEMTHEEAMAFLDSNPGWIVLSTIDAQGYPHAVPLGYHREGDLLYVNARGQRLTNARRNPRVSLLLEDGREMADLRGLLIQGDAEVVDDPAEVLEVTRRSMRWRGTPEDTLPTEVRPGGAFLRITLRKLVTWDNPKQRRERPAL